MRYAIRALLRDKGLALTAIATLALGIGANTAIFSVVNGVLLRPLAYKDPDRLFLVRTVAPALAHVAPDLPVNARHFHEWRSACRACEEVALVGGRGFTLTGGGEPERLPGLQVSSNFFRTLGVQPRIGRDFDTAEELRDRSRVIIIADSLWRRRFGSDPSIIGRTILLDGEPNEVIGVLPSSLSFPKGDQWGELFPHKLPPLIFRPLGFDVSQRRAMGEFDFSSLIRLKQNVSPQSAQAELNAAIADFARQFKFEMQARLVPFEQQVTAEARTGLWILFAAVGAVLLIVCVNLGNLMLVRTTSRYRDAAIRMALGASRSVLFAQVLKEAFVLVAAGGFLGLLIAYAGLQSFLANAPVDLPRLQEVRMDWRVLGFATLISAFSGLLCAFIPAWRLISTQPQDSLRAASITSTEAGTKLRFRELLVGVEVALSTALLIVGGLLMVSFFRLTGVDKGFEVQHVITQDISLGPPRYRDAVSRNQFVDEALRKLSGIPSVTSVGMTSQLPLQGETFVDAIVDQDKQARESETPPANFRFVSPGYWRAMGIGLKQGRFIEETDRNRAVAIVGQRAAQRLWPNQNALGKRIRRGGPNRPVMEVVGAVADVRAGLEKEPPLMVYEPYWTLGPGGPSFVLRTAMDPTAVSNQVRAVIASLDRELPIPQPKTMQQILDESVAMRRFQTLIAVAFAVSALLLTSIGIYGVISFSVIRRTPELGIRIALGARASEITTMVILQGMLPVAGGLVAGVACAVMVTRLITSQLYGVGSYDPLTIAGVALLLAGVCAMACWIPARRAARVDPMRALRFE